MYTSNILVERIRLMIKEKQVTVKELLSSCELNENTLNQLSDKKGLSSFSLAKIADYLDCSVDYLLGRTDEPTAEVNNNIITTGNVITTGDITPVASGENSTSNGIIIDSKAPAKDVAELVDLIQSLPLVKRAEAIVYMNNLKNGGD